MNSSSPGMVVWFLKYKTAFFSRVTVREGEYDGALMFIIFVFVISKMPVEYQLLCLSCEW